jgi:hypothetical protein
VLTLQVALQAGDPEGQNCNSQSCSCTVVVVVPGLDQHGELASSQSVTRPKLMNPVHLIQFAALCAVSFFLLPSDDCLSDGPWNRDPAIHPGHNEAFVHLELWTMANELRRSGTYQHLHGRGAMSR